MSTKSTLFYTTDNEHAYVDSLENTIVIEMDKRNIKILSNDDEELIVEIAPGSQLYEHLLKTKSH